MHYSMQLRAISRVAAGIVQMLTLTGCMGTSPGMQVASFAGGSLVTEWTGKSLSDHALSLAVSQDCEFLRLIEGRPLCRDYVAPVSLQTTDRREAPAATAPPTGAAGKTSSGVVTAAPARRMVLVLGRFRSRRNAQAIAAEYAPLDPTVVAGAAVGSPWEVHIGPVTPARSHALARALSEIGEPPVAVLAFTPRLVAAPPGASAGDSGVPGLVRAQPVSPARGQ